MALQEKIVSALETYLSSLRITLTLKISGYAPPKLIFPPEFRDVQRASYEIKLVANFAELIEPISAIVIKHGGSFTIEPNWRVNWVMVEVPALALFDLAECNLVEKIDTPIKC